MLCVSSNLGFAGSQRHYSIRVCRKDYECPLVRRVKPPHWRANREPANRTGPVGTTALATVSRVIESLANTGSGKTSDHGGHSFIYLPLEKWFPVSR
jgi:hypothetical protein